MAWYVNSTHLFTQVVPTCESGSLGDQKRVLDVLEVELYRVMKRGDGRGVRFGGLEMADRRVTGRNR